ncbi:MAG TPA: TM0106 family RecB-like putative nuclease, partial [Candidatus Limnocylindrales bacterium]
MFLLENGKVVLSASDLTAAAACEFAVLRGLDARLGRVPGVEPAPDAMLERVAALGGQHEQAVLKGYVRQFGLYPGSGGGGVASVARPKAGSYGDGQALRAAHATTVEFLDAGADVIYQAGFFDGHFVGWADFLVRDGDRWQVQDTKLARSEKVTALLQLAAYANQLAKTGHKVADKVALILGSGTVSEFRTMDLIPVFEQRMVRMRALVDERVAATGPLAWGAPGVTACLRCEECAPFVEQARDVLLVAGLTVTQRARLAAAGVHAMEQLATSTGPVDGIGAATLKNLRLQARLQVAQDEANAGRGDDDPLVVKWEITEPAVLGTLPAPDVGDIFFDFEGDPLWTDDTVGSDGAAVWGLEYLFGVIEAPVGDAEPVFRPFWAHDRAGEKQAMVSFMTYLLERRQAHPGMHVYHYAPYERSALLRLAGRHGVFEDELDALLRGGVLVDLYATVRAGLRTGERAYSLKNVEHVYGMAHVGDVKKADQSIVEYANACVLRDVGDVGGWQAKLDQIGDYNRTDCLSTLQLRDWLLARGAEFGVPPQHAATAGEAAPVGDDGLVVDALDIPLTAFADPPGAPLGPRTPRRQAVAMLAAALGYHWREAKPF